MSTLTDPPTSSTSAFLSTTEARRSNYRLSNRSPIPDPRIRELVTHAILHVPSAFNSQTTRLVVLLRREHQQLWDVVKDVFRAQVPREQFGKMAERLDGFRAGYGTILFYEDTAVMREFQDRFKQYEDKFPAWSEQTSGMHQYHLWTSLSSSGLACNLQHYNPAIDIRLATEWDVSPDWSLKAQLVFGEPVGPPGQPGKEKVFGPVEERVRVFGDSE